MADYQERVAERIIRAREQAGFDREPFALKAGVSVKQLGRIEKGKSNPRLSTIRKLALAAGVKVTDIRPDLDEEEQAIRAQLDRIERKLDELLRRVKRDEEGGTGPPPPSQPPTPPTPEPKTPDGGESRSRPARRRPAS